MHSNTFLAALCAAGFGVAFARPTSVNARDSIDNQARSLGHGRNKWNSALQRREVPQEHSHEIFITVVNEFLKKNNPDNIQDAIFGLLGNAAASQGLGSISDPDCLQQATADRAFTNAKAENDIDGMTAALIYRGLERNTGAVGQASVACTAITAVNPEIAAISQHQDPASNGAAATNKAIALQIALQISKIGGEPFDALDSGTFQPGQIGDPTARGNTCNTLDDQFGCIFSQDLIVEDATEAEVLAFVASGAGAGGGGNGGNAGGAASTSAAVSTTTAAAATTTDAAATTTDAAATTTTTAAGAATTTTTTTTAASTTSAPPPAGTGAVDLGRCRDPTVFFAPNLDGRREAFAFAPKDKSSFDHGAAENLKTITDFICKYHFGFVISLIRVVR